MLLQTYNFFAAKLDIGILKVPIGQIYINSSNSNNNVYMYRRKEGKMKVKIGAHKGLILTLPLYQIRVEFVDVEYDIKLQRFIISYKNGNVIIPHC